MSESINARSPEQDAFLNKLCSDGKLRAGSSLAISVPAPDTFSSLGRRILQLQEGDYLLLQDQYSSPSSQNNQRTLVGWKFLWMDGLNDTPKMDTPFHLTYDDLATYYEKFTYIPALNQNVVPEGRSQ